MSCAHFFVLVNREEVRTVLFVTIILVDITLKYFLQNWNSELFCSGLFQFSELYFRFLRYVVSLFWMDMTIWHLHLTWQKCQFLIFDFFKHAKSTACCQKTVEQNSITVFHFFIYISTVQQNIHLQYSRVRSSDATIRTVVHTFYMMRCTFGLLSRQNAALYLVIAEKGWDPSNSVSYFSQWYEMPKKLRETIL